MTDPDILNNNDAPFPGFPVFGRSPSYRTVGSTSLRRRSRPVVTNCAAAGNITLEFSTNVAPSMFDQQGGLAELHQRQYVRAHVARQLTGLEDRTTTNWNIDNTPTGCGLAQRQPGGIFMQVNHVRMVWSAAEITLG
jgi:hypothetical protein